MPDIDPSKLTTEEMASAACEWPLCVVYGLNNQKAKELVLSINHIPGSQTASVEEISKRLAEKSPEPWNKTYGDEKDRKELDTKYRKNRIEELEKSGIDVRKELQTIRSRPPTPPGLGR